MRSREVVTVLAPEPKRGRSAVDLFRESRMLAEEVLLGLGVDVDAMPGGCIVPAGRRSQGPPSYPPSD